MRCFILIYFSNKPPNITHGYTSCSLYGVDPSEDEQQACSKHAEAYYWNKLIENSAYCWFILYWYITLHGQQNFKSEEVILIGFLQVCDTTKSAIILCTFSGEDAI
jgi:hypothetical protein